MADVLSDLTRLSQFAGTNVPAAPLNGPCLALFGQLMTHPTRVTYPWSPLRTTLSSYFNTVNPTQGLDPSRVQSGWCGLSLVATSFRRLELVQSEVEKQQVLEWLQAVKQVAIIRSLTFRDATSNELYDVINEFQAPISPQDLEQFEAIAARGAAEIMAHNPPQDWNVANGSKLVAAAAAAPNSTNQQQQQQQPSSNPQQQGFDNDAIDPLDMSESDEGAVEDDGDDYVEGAGTRKRKRRASSSTQPKKEGAIRSSSVVQEMEQAGPGAARGEGEETLSDRPIVSRLAKRINEMTGIAVNKCVESLSRFSDDDLGSINPHLPIPPQFLPGGQGPPQGRGANFPSTSSSKPKSSSAANRQRSTTSVGPEGFSTSGNAMAGTSTGAATPSSSAGGGGGGGGRKSSKASKPHDPNRPSFSYSALIGQAILGNPDKRARLSEIYDFVMTNYPYYRRNESGWQNSIRHNLSLQPVFRKIPDDTFVGNKKSCFWTIKEEEEWRFAGGGWQKMGVGSGNHRRSSSTKAAGAGTGSASASPAPGGGGGHKRGTKRKAGATNDDDDDDFGDAATPGAFSDDE
ncbi:hypothetical protein ACM66B_004224 [Microbotryomycetes sp. NB124-2]